MAFREYRNWGFWWGRPYRHARELLVSWNRLDRARPHPKWQIQKFRHNLTIRFQWPISISKF